MRLCTSSIVSAAILSALIGTSVRAANLAPVSAVTRCETLAKADIDAAVGAKTRIASAGAIHEGPGAGYCRVKGSIEPAVGFEVRLPLAGWTQRFLQTGCGGLCGHLDIHVEKADACKPVLNGEFALASTDMGHEGGMDGSWGRDNYQARVDFAYRGVHVTTLAAKALIERYYGQKPRYSYFSGCSDGGREALMEAQRYPEDFNGIMAGAPAMNFTTQNSFYHGWNAITNRDADGQPILTADKLPILHRAVIEQCDAPDGLRDGLISDPVHCHPDLSKITCRAGQSADSCLSTAQARVAIEIYRGAHDAAGRGLVIDGPMPGSELNWVGVYVPPAGESRTMSAMAAEGTIRNLDSDPNPPADFSLNDFHFDAANFNATTRLHGLYDATDTDLARFQKSRRPPHPVARPCRPAHFTDEYGRLLRRDAAQHGNGRGRWVRAAVFISGRFALRRRRGTLRLRHDERDAGVGGGQAGAGGASGKPFGRTSRSARHAAVAENRRRRQGRPHPPRVPIPASRKVPGPWQHRRSIQHRAAAGQAGL